MAFIKWVFSNCIQQLVDIVDLISQPPHPKSSTGARYAKFLWPRDLAFDVNFARGGGY